MYGVLTIAHIAQILWFIWSGKLGTAKPHLEWHSDTLAASALLNTGLQHFGGPKTDPNIL